MTAILPFVPLPRQPSALVLGSAATEPTITFADLLDSIVPPQAEPPPEIKPDSGENSSDWLRAQLVQFAHPTGPPIAPQAESGAPAAEPQMATASIEIIATPTLAPAPPPAPVHVVAEPPTSATIVLQQPEPMAGFHVTPVAPQADTPRPQAIATSPASPPPAKSAVPPPGAAMVSPSAEVVVPRPADAVPPPVETPSPPAGTTAPRTSVAAAPPALDSKPAVSLPRNSKRAIQPGLIHAAPAALPVASAADAPAAPASAAPSPATPPMADEPVVAISAPMIAPPPATVDVADQPARSDSPAPVTTASAPVALPQTVIATAEPVAPAVPPTPIITAQPLTVAAPPAAPLPEPPAAPAPIVAAPVVAAPVAPQISAATVSEPAPVVPDPEPVALPILRLQQGKPAAPLRTHMFGFSELGMFGEFGAQFSALQAVAATASLPSKPSGTPVQAAVPPQSSETVLEAFSQAAPQQRASVRAFSSSPRFATLPAMTPALRAASPAAVPFEEPPPPLETLPIVAPVLPSAPPARIPAASGGYTIAANGDEVAVLPGSPPAKPILRNPAPPAPNPFNLLVTGPAGALSVAVRSAGETAENFAKMRRLAEDTAAEFGMDVAEFQLNGSAPEHGFTSMLGGTRGNRTR